MIKKINIIFSVLSIIFVFAYSGHALNIEELNISEDLYLNAQIKILVKRIYVYNCFGNKSKAIETLNTLKNIQKNPSFHDYLLKEIMNNGKKSNNSFYSKTISVYTNSTLNKILENAKSEKDNLRKIRLYKSYLVHKPDATDIYIKIGKCYMELRKYYTARKWFSKVENNYKARDYIDKIDYLLNKTVHVMTVKVNEQKKELKKDEIDKEEKIDNLIKNKNIEEAVELIKKLSYDEPANYQYMFKLSQIYYNEANYTESLKYLEKTIILNKNFYQALYMKGEILSKTGEFNEALNVFKKIEKHAPKESKYHRLSVNMIKLLSTAY